MKTIVTQEYMLNINGVTLYAKKWHNEKSDSAIPIILLHESLGCVDLWKDFPDRLSASTLRTVIAYDRHGYGKSERKEHLPSLHFMESEAEIFPLICEELGLQEYILFGHSTGGSIAVIIASFDIKCKAVITESSQAFVEDRTLEGIRKAKESFKDREHFRRLEKWHGNKTGWVLDAWTETWLAPGFRTWSLAGWIKKVNCPLLAIHGDNDEFGSTAFPEYLSSRTSGPGEMAIINDCGHIPHKEKPDEILFLIQQFLKKYLL